MKRMVSVVLVLSLVFLLFSVVNVAATTDFKTYTDNFEYTVKSNAYLETQAKNGSFNAALVENAENNYLSLAYDSTNGFYNSMIAVYRLADTTKDAYSALYPNNNGTGKVKISFKYKIDKLVTDTTLYVYRFDSGAREIQNGANCLDPSTLTNHIKAVEMAQNKTTDGWVTVDNLIISTEVNTPIFIAAYGIRSAGQNSQIYIDDIVVEETDESAYTIDVGGVKSTIVGKPGSAIDKTKFNVPSSKIITGIFDEDGNELTVFPEDTNTVLYVKTAFVNDFEDTAKSNAYLATQAKNGSFNAALVENAENNYLSLAYDSSNEFYNSMIAVYRLADTTKDAYSALYPNNNGTGKVKISFKYKIDKLVTNTTLYVYRYDSGAREVQTSFDPSTLTNHIKAVEMAQNKTTDGWVTVDNLIISTEVNTPIFIAAYGIRSAGQNSQIYIDDIVVEETDESAYKVDVNGTQYQKIAKPGAMISVVDFAVPFGKKITEFTVDGVSTNVYPEVDTETIYATLGEDNNALSLNSEGIITNSDGSKVIFDGSRYVLSYDVKNSGEAEVTAQSTVSSLTGNTEPTALVSKALTLPSASAKTVDAVVTPALGSYIKLVSDNAAIENVKIVPYSEQLLDYTSAVMDFDASDAKIYGSGDVALQNGAVSFKAEAGTATTVKNYPTVFLQKDTSFLKTEPNEPYRISFTLTSEVDVDNIAVRLGYLSSIKDGVLSDQITNDLVTYATLNGNLSLKANEPKVISVDYKVSTSGFITLGIGHNSLAFDITLDNITYKKLYTQEAPTEIPEVIDQTKTTLTLKAYDGYIYGYNYNGNETIVDHTKSAIIYGLSSGKTFPLAYARASTDTLAQSPYTDIVFWTMKELGDVNVDGTVDAADMKALRHNLLSGITEETKFKGLMDLNEDKSVDIRDLVNLAEVVS